MNLKIIADDCDCLYFILKRTSLTRDLNIINTVRLHNPEGKQIVSKESDGMSVRTFSRGGAIVDFSRGSHKDFFNGAKRGEILFYTVETKKTISFF